MLLNAAPADRAVASAALSAALASPIAAVASLSASHDSTLFATRVLMAESKALR